MFVHSLHTTHVQFNLSSFCALFGILMSSGVSNIDCMMSHFEDSSVVASMRKVGLEGGEYEFGYGILCTWWLL